MRPPRATRKDARSPAPSGSILLAIVRLVIFVLDTLVFFPVLLLAAIGDPEGRRAYGVVRWWAWLNLRLCGVTVATSGLTALDPRSTYVFMSNHRSPLDVLVLVVALWDYQLRWVAKRELGRIPLVGLGLRATRQILVDGRDHAQEVASLVAARRKIDAGTSVVFFPEGTRSAGPLLPFQEAGFSFAIEAGARIVPIGIAGPPSVLGRHGALCRLRAEVQVAIRPPVATGGLTLDDRDVLLARVRWAIAGAAHGRRPLPPAAHPSSRDSASARIARGA